MQRINKPVCLLFLLFLFVAIFATYSYLNVGVVNTRWGKFYGESAFGAVLGYWLITFIMGFFSIKKK